jgi:hypothetical protein
MIPPVIEMADAQQRGCSWCFGEVAPGSSYCTTCKLKLVGGVIVGVVAALVLLVGILATVLWVCFRGSR